jgi:hypothetical protein
MANKKENAFSADDHLTKAVKGVAVVKPKRRMVGRIPIVRGDDFARSGNVEVNLVTRAWDGFTSSIA